MYKRIGLKKKKKEANKIDFFGGRGGERNKIELNAIVYQPTFLFFF